MVRPRLCLFTASPAPSGLGLHMLALARGLGDRYDVTIVASPTGGLPLLARARAAGIGVKMLGSESTAEREELSGWLVREGIEVFHDHSGIGWEGIEAIEAAIAAEIPVIVRTEHLPYLLTDEVQVARHRRMLGMLHAMIAVSAGAGATMLAAGVPSSLLHVVRNGIADAGMEMPRSDPGATRRELGIPPEARLVLNVGRLTPQKAHDILLDASAVLKGRSDEVWLVIAGIGPEGLALEKQARALGIADRVMLLGTHGDVPRLLQAADLFVLPSRFEGLPLSLLEAMAARVPVVATRVIGSEEVIQHGRSGLLVPVDDAPALAAAIGSVLDDPQLARRLGAAAYDSVRRDFSATRMVAETAAIYDELLAPWEARRTRAGRIAGIEETPGH
ncbi:MAG: glycosyltransferase family 4 protein [Chloroflexi bacterium]|nr:glycosyltransferase family 4 protein [Chloroflexota bacterium]